MLCFLCQTRYRLSSVQFFGFFVLRGLDGRLGILLLGIIWLLILVPCDKQSHTGPELFSVLRERVKYKTFGKIALA